MANKIGCQVGRTKIIDPNIFDGQSSSNNIPVNNEDLTISVILQTFKKGRTVLSAGSKSGNNFESSSDVEVNFIDGSGINGKRVLTTNYTDLTMIGDDNTTDGAGEGLGITSIDIDFNSQLAPMITINFIDVRGSAIFQNEENITGGRNKYATFFQLPYPLFELTIKGYYGKPVKYCLHLTKFNSRFNSKTGNFEITASFIGYTYAMLSDMLIGYLKAIPYTEVGKTRYSDINTTRASIGLGKILNLNELMIKISNINEEIQKLSAKDEDAAQLDSIDANKDVLLLIENNLKTFGYEVDSRDKETKDKTDKFDYVIQTGVKDVTTTVNSSKVALLENVKKFNENGIVTLDEKLFSLAWNFNEVNIKSLQSDNASSVLNKDKTRAYGIVNYINKNKISLLEETLFNVWDLTDAYVALEIAKSALETNYKVAKEGLAITIKNKIYKVIGFDPTVRNIIEIFTTAVEVFMESIWSVSNKAELDADGLRAAQLITKFKGSSQRSDLPPTNSKYINQIHPWPDYREEDKDLTYTEKYLGAKGVLPIPLDVEELYFIDDLLRAFIVAQQETEKAQNITNSSDTNWFPVNPIDTRLFGIEVSPYARLSSSERNEVVKLMLLRGITFLGYTNSYLSSKEIDAFIDNEYQEITNNLPDDSTGSLKMSLGSLTLNEVELIVGEINGDKNLVLAQNYVGFYTYSMMNPYNDIYKKVSPLPIDNSFGGAWPTTNAGLVNKNGTTKFLTNYNNNAAYGKDVDGGIYLKIFTIDEYKNNLSLVTSSADSKIKPLIYEKLMANDMSGMTKINSAGFNPFGGSYGIQEFETIDWGDSGTDYSDLPLMYMFYAYGSYTGLGFNRNKSTLKTTEFDYGKNFKFVKSTDIQNFINNRTTHKSYTTNRKNFKLIKDGNLDIVYPYVNQSIGGDTTTSVGYGGAAAGTGASTYSNNAYMSLFGSRWYYGQNQGPTLTPYANEAQALLFLNTLPWNDMPFEANEIKHLFNARAGFIHAPKLWCAFVGGLLWRNSSIESGDVDPIKWYYPASVTNPLLLPNKPNNDFVQPKRAQFFNKLYVDGGNYKNYNNMLAYMPQQAKNEFISVFHDFVNLEWEALKSNCEIVSDGSIASFETKLSNVYGGGVKNSDGTISVDASIIEANFDNVNKYKIITPVDRSNYDSSWNSEVPRQMFLEFDTSVTDYNPSSHIINLLQEEYIIANTGYKIWQENDEINPEKYSPITVPWNDMEYYINGIIKKFKDVQNSLTPTAIKKQREQSIFNTSDEDIIKLQLYRHCKNTFDKWLGGSDNIDNIIFQCGKNTRNAKDNDLAQFYRPGDVKARLIDSFRFVDRSYGDIGDKLYINPTPVNDYLINSPNTSFYDAVGHLLASNNFNFIALPTFINYNKTEELNAIFDTYPYYEEAISGGTCGPTFVCVYDGQKSKHLDFGDSNYTNDGIDFQCDGKGGVLRELPKDFSASANKYDSDVAVFSVNYSQQNQNIFKDITLDQSEFTETAESLQITDDIASKGAENNRSLAGQNIYNVYSVRSYKAEVEMMGNAMIQPMMHFQLNNIPMFHGGYLITRVKHNIKPNHMSTSFTGVRIRFPKTKLLEGVDFYMNMIDSMDLSNTSNGTATANSVARSVPPIVNTIKENGGLPSNIEIGNITMTSIPKIDGIRNQLVNDKNKNRLINEAIIPLKNMLTAWVDWMKNDAGFTGFVYDGDKNVYYAEITSAFRSVDDQKNAGKNKATGVSNHQWGIAIDLKMAKKDGTLLPIEQNLELFKIKNNPALEWLLDNSWKYGFVTPFGMRDGKGKYNEYWHYEYHGTAAVCLMENNPVTYGGHVTKIVKNNDVVKDFVINPKDKDGKIAIYNGCDYVYVKNDQGTIDNGEQIETKLIYEQLKKQLGYSDEGIAGVMGNIYQESRFKPTITNKDDGGYGLAQWTGVRKPELLDWLSSYNLNNSSYIDQIKYLNYELQGTFKYTAKNLKINNDAENSTKIFYVTYEGGNLGSKNFTSSEVDKRLNELKNSDNTYDKRVDFAKQFSIMIKNKDFKYPI